MSTVYQTKPIVSGKGLGARILGVDLSHSLDDETFRLIERAYNENAVIVIPGQKLSPSQQIEFSRRFGPLKVNMLKQYLLPGHEEIIVISNVVENGKPIGQADAGHHWHTDESYLAEPARGSILHALEVPVKDGEVLGDTRFTSTAEAYDALPGSMKIRLAGLKAVHSWAGRYRNIKQTEGNKHLSDEDRKKIAPEVVHPVIRTHPVTGRKCIYVNPGFTIRIADMPQAESQALLDELWAHCQQPQFQYRHRWTVGDVVMWDNCAAWHFAIPDYQLPLRRRMHRTTTQGTRPF
jgi:taurine dioxygenase